MLLRDYLRREKICPIWFYVYMYLWFYVNIVQCKRFFRGAKNESVFIKRKKQQQEMKAFS